MIQTKPLSKKVFITKQDLKAIRKTPTGQGPLTEKDIKAIEKSFAVFTASASDQELGIGYFRL